MGIVRRLTRMFKSQANAALDKAEDPNQLLDASYDRQIALLRDVRRGIVEVTAARRRLELQAQEIHNRHEKLTEQARSALEAGREDLARLALEKKQIAKTQLDDFDRQISDLEAEQQRLVKSEARLAAAVEAFRTRKEVIKAQYSAAQAQARIGEAVSGLSEESADVSYAIRRAEDRTAQLRSRGEAITELIESGTLTGALAPGDTLDRELARLAGANAVDNELAALKRELASGKQARAQELEPGQ